MGQLRNVLYEIARLEERHARDWWIEHDDEQSYQRSLAWAELAVLLERRRPQGG